MSISFNTYKTLISNVTSPKLGLDVYTRNLSSSMVTAKLFSTIQKNTSSENISLLSTVQSSLKSITDQSRQLKKVENYYDISTRSSAVQETSTTLDTKRYAKDFTKLGQSLNQLMSTFENHGQSAPRKRIESAIKFLRPELKALGVEIDARGIQVDADQLSEQLKNGPKAIKTLSQFAGMSANAVKNLNPTTLLKEDAQKTYDNSAKSPFYLNNIGTIIDNNPSKGSLFDLLV